MRELFETALEVTPGVADATGALSYQGAFRLFMDMASMHAELLGVGLKDMKARGLFWVTVKTRIRFSDRPSIGDRLLMRTWPEAPDRVRCYRNYEIRRGEEVLVAGRTEWAVINIRTHAVEPMEGVFPAGLSFLRASAIPEGFDRIPAAFSEEPFASYRVSSTDIDIGGHMNNAAYATALMGCFSNAEVHAMNPAEIQLIYRTPCFEGDVLDIRKKQTEDALLLRFSKGEDTILLAKMKYNPGPAVL